LWGGVGGGGGGGGGWGGGAPPPPPPPPPQTPNPQSPFLFFIFDLNKFINLFIKIIKFIFIKHLTTKY